ncbi:MAG: ABC transporter substrate-binding protein [Alkalibacterium gilvum]|uniref:ABC transporter substrate-binding protein n=1 Tax=Alkalibacterium gilvum TaxID=1130080 RepID=UPI003F92715F
MKRNIKAVLALLCVGIVLGGCGNKQEKETSGKGSEERKVILITMDSTDQHWVSMNEGAEKAAKELGNVNYIWMAPDKKDDAQQIERINNAISEGADAIMIAASGADAVVAPLEEAKAEGIKIVYVDSPANTKGEATFATDNTEAGKTAGEEMIAALKEKGITDGKIGIVNFNSAAETAIKREEGFRNALKDSNFSLMETQYGEGDTTKSQDIADNFISNGAVGIFATNEGSTVGTGNAIKGSGQDIIGIGFDKSDAIYSLIKEGSILSSIGQNPEVMGSEGLKAAFDAIEGKEISEKLVDTGVIIIDKEEASK